MGAGGISTHTRMFEAYRQLVADGTLSADPAQEAAAERLNDLSQALAQSGSNGGIAGFFKRRKSAPKGLYLWGDVGRGKTLLMDLFFEQVEISAKRRVHFHEFMDEMHSAIAAFRKTQGESADADPIAAVVKPVIRDVRLLCFDEFHVTDITNAMLLGRLFEKLFGAGLVMVATSNVPPDELYKNGLNRQLFLPFIDLLKARCDVMELGAARDYRLEKLSGQPVFQFGTGDEVRPAMDQLWESLTGGQQTHEGTVKSLGRSIKVPETAMGAARFSFADLCDKPLGARDYLAISHDFHTLMIDGVPQFDRSGSNAAKRFIQLIDTLYDRGVKLAASFAVPLDELSKDQDTAFEMQRCISRLQEMQSEDYLGGPLNG